jgi:hypothetical protein
MKTRLIPFLNLELAILEGTVGAIVRPLVCQAVDHSELQATGLLADEVCPLAVVVAEANGVETSGQKWEKSWARLVNNSANAWVIGV